MNQFSRAWKFYTKNWKFFIVLAAPIMMLEIAMASMITPIQNVTQPEDILEFFNENKALLGSVSLLSIVLSMAFMGALFVSYASIESENEIEPLSALFLGIRKFFPLLGAYLIASVGVFFGILLLILPAFYVAARLCIFPAFIMLEDKSAIESLKLSWEKTDEHGTTLFGLTIAFFSLTMICASVAQSIISPGLTQLAVLAIIEYVIVIPWGYVYFSLYKSLNSY